MLRTFTLAYSGATILSFISRVIAFLFLSPEIGGTDGHFVDIIGFEYTKYNIQNMLATVHCRALVVYCCDHMSDRDLRLPVTAQHQKSVSYCILLDLEKIKIKVWFLLKAFFFYTIVKSKNCKSNRHK